MSKTLFVVNPEAGRGRGRKELPKLVETLRRLEIDAEIKLTSGPLEAGRFAEEALADGCGLVVAAGGDGTINEVANALARAKSEGGKPKLGVIPVGSGNDFAQALRLPRDVEKALEIIKRGRTRTIDVGRVEVDGTARYFVNAVGLGIDGEVALELAGNRLARGLLMYLLAAVKVTLTGRWPYRMRVTMGSENIEETITLITVANGIQSGGGFKFTPGALLDDGMFDVCYGGPLSKLSIFGLMGKVIKGEHGSHPAIRMAKTSEVSINVPLGVPAHIDGEILSASGRDFRFGIHPGLLDVIA